jgi:LmbE family N-acetylglucosaminyl deacetylase
VEITDHFDKKMAAVRLHQTQMRHFTDPLAFFRNWAEEVAARHNLRPGSLAEEFHRISTV